jgi:uncharacterized membrane protein
MVELARSRKFWNHLSKPFKFFLIIVLSLGIFFRFFNIDKKYYWTDEAFTSLRISGYLREEVRQQVFTGRQITVEELRQYQAVNSKKNVLDTVKGLAKEEAQLPPLYFVMVRLWTQLFGSSIAVTRSLSALINLLAFPCIYWLCLELFESPFVGGIAVMLLAISPFQVAYAQEARMYSLWSVQILLTSAVFLRAIRLNTKSSWLVYSLSIALGLYTHLLSILVAIAQGVYLVIIERFHANKKIFYYLVSCLIAIILFTPWILTIINYSSGAKSSLAWLEKTASLQESLISFVNNICNSFIDFWSIYAYFPDLNFPNVKFGLFLKPLLLILIGYSFYFVCRNTPLKVWLFVLNLTFIPPLLISIRDIAANSGSLSQARYLIPSYLGILIALAYLFATKSKQIFLKLWQKKFWQLSMVLLISFGILSCAISLQAVTWSNKYGMNYYPVVRIVNQSERPLLISDSDASFLLPLSHYLAPKVKLQLLSVSNLSKLTNNFNNFSDIFLFQPSNQLKQIIQKRLNYKIVRVKKVRGLSKLEPST